MLKMLLIWIVAFCALGVATYSVCDGTYWNSCSGTADLCSSFVTVASCDEQDGCTGAGGTCDEFGDESTCDAHSECYWYAYYGYCQGEEYFDSCTGTATACSSMGDETTCDMQSGCTSNYLDCGLTCTNSSHCQENIECTWTDTCTYTSGNWDVDFCDNCFINNAVDVGGNNISITGNGTFTTNASITGWNLVTFIGNSTIFKSIVTCFQGGCFQ